MPKPREPEDRSRTKRKRIIHRRYNHHDMCVYIKRKYNINYNTRRALHGPLNYSDKQILSYGVAHSDSSYSKPCKTFTLLTPHYPVSVSDKVCARWPFVQILYVQLLRTEAEINIVFVISDNYDRSSKVLYV